MQSALARCSHGIGKILVCLALMGAISGFFLAATPNVAHAQDEGKDEGPKEATLQNPIVHFFSSIGYTFGIVFLGLSIGTVALIIILFMDLRMSEAISPAFVDEFTGMVNKRQFKQAYELAKNDTSYLSRVLSAGMSRLQYGLEDAREAAMNTLESIKSDKDQKNNYNAVIATLGPMFGLVGTVYGMIKAFSVLATATQVNPAKLADGISHALVVTLFGVAISVPAIFFNAFFRNRITRVTMDVGHIADDLLTQMYHNSKKPAAPPTPGAPPAPPGAAPTQPRV